MRMLLKAPIKKTKKTLLLLFRLDGQIVWFQSAPERTVQEADLKSSSMTVATEAIGVSQVQNL